MKLLKKPITVKCIMCRKRESRVAKWKTARENITCLTCFVMESYMKDVCSAINAEAEKKGTSIRVKIQYKWK